MPPNVGITPPLAEEKEITVSANVESLTAVNEFVADLIAPTNCPMGVQMKIELIVEEIFVNIANYAYDDAGGTATVRGVVAGEPPVLTLSFADEGIPYNPLSQDAPDLSLSVENRPIGGLVIFIVRKNADDVTYEHKDGKNILTVAKKLV